LIIAVAGDGRAEYQWNPHRACDEKGINKWVTTAIAKAIANDNASILLWTGDIVNVNGPTDGSLLGDGIDDWRDSMRPLYDKNVKVWPVRGNHEVYRYVSKENYDGVLIQDAPAIWKQKFPEIPQTDPKSADGLSFYSVQGSALIVGLDDYAGADSEPLKRKHSIDQTWLNQVLQKNQQQPFKFVFGHEAAIMAGHHADDDTLSANSDTRNSFVQSLMDAKALYLCGHDHFYDRMSIARLSSAMFQITAGTAGAPFYPPGQYAGSAVWKLDRAAHIDNVYGYVLIKVEGDQATVTFKGAPASCFGTTGLVKFEPLDEIVCGSLGCKSVCCDNH
jgi:hypothetical protein